jgi:hypothetical protein
MNWTEWLHSELRRLHLRLGDAPSYLNCVPRAAAEASRAALNCSLMLFDMLCHAVLCRRMVVSRSLMMLSCTIHVSYVQRTTAVLSFSALNFPSLM